MLYLYHDELLTLSYHVQWLLQTRRDHRTRVWPNCHAHAHLHKSFLRSHHSLLGVFADYRHILPTHVMAVSNLANPLLAYWPHRILHRSTNLHRACTDSIYFSNNCHNLNHNDFSALPYSPPPHVESVTFPMETVFNKETLSKYTDIHGVT